MLCEEGIGRNGCWRESTDCDILRSGEGGESIVCESLGGSNDDDDADDGEGGGPYAGFFKIPVGVNLRDSCTGDASLGGGTGGTIK